MAFSLVGVPAESLGREWSDTTGQYTVEADLIAFDDETVVLQRADGDLAAIEIAQLSQADHDWLETEEAKLIAGKASGDMQQWTMQSGLQVIGKVVDYTRRDVTLERRRSKVFVNDRLFDNLPEVYRIIVLRIVSYEEGFEVADKERLTSWLVRQRGGPRTFTCDGVVLELESGDEYAVPFFLFSEADLNVMQPGWEEWLAAHQEQDYDERDDQAFLLRSAAAARSQDQQVDREIAQMQLVMQAVTAGVTSLWEVTLYPAAGTGGQPYWVVMPGRNSAEASQAALANNPGYVVGPVRRVSN